MSKQDLATKRMDIYKAKPGMLVVNQTWLSCLDHNNLKIQLTPYKLMLLVSVEVFIYKNRCYVRSDILLEEKVYRLLELSKEKWNESFRIVLP